MSPDVAVREKSRLVLANDLYNNGREHPWKASQYFKQAWEIIEHYNPPEGSPDFAETMTLKNELSRRLDFIQSL